jgi:DNA-binding beta-propeller fold protein YncE
VFTPGGKLDRILGEVGTAPGKLRYPYDLSLDRKGRLYIAEYGNSRVSIFEPDGKFITSFGGSGRSRGEFSHPWGVTVASDGEIFVADTMNYRVQLFPPLDAAAAETRRASTSGP